MKALEELKAALAAVAQGEQGEWTIGSRHGDTVVYSGKGPVFGGSFCDYIEPTEVEYHFIVLAHNLMPALIECVEALEELHDIVQGHLDDKLDKLDSFTVQPARAALAKLQEIKS